MVRKSWTYEKAGVPHLKGQPAYNRDIRRIIRSTYIPGVTGNPTGFAALFDFKKYGFRDPLLVSSTDGVGTKLEIARLLGRHDTVGIDLVAMCVNDIITYGAKPIFFLDYFATANFNPVATREILKGIARGCREAGCALIGGETAIMPGFYSTELKQGVAQYDLAGFAVGLVEREKIVTGADIRKGDVLLGLASTGFHSNGFSLLRKIFSESELKGPLGKKFLVPTRIYVKPVLRLLMEIPLKGIVNITGGGFVDNLPRVIPDGLRATVRRDSWPQPKIFQWVQNSGNIQNFEMMRTFNLGIGMILILDRGWIKKAQRILQRMNIPAWAIGEITPGRSLEVQ
ncbi:MAG: phosphoribosylformylglycinamidine cyclo-ligase [Candidatus Omnitrophica bacterium]|nr:phosphoribosylformylglycinamidine cyclo-ligase [Candidatus Omnitrophota bacterium]